jgi:hypothetical protein
MKKKAFYLLTLFFLCIAIALSWNSRANAGIDLADAYNPGLPEGPWKVTAVGPVKNIPGVGSRHTANLSWTDGSSRMLIESYCIEPGDPSLKLNDTCWKIDDTHQKLHCVNGQDQRWLETLEESWMTFLPAIERTSVIQQACSCEGYSARVKKNEKPQFKLDLLPDPNYGTGPLVTIIKGDVVSLAFNWDGGEMGSDPCYANHYVKIKLPEQNASLANCSGSTCTFSCSEIGEGKTARITAVVELVGETCLGIFETYDPEGYELPLAPED